MFTRVVGKYGGKRNEIPAWRNVKTTENEHRRRGVTLLELLIVCALIVALMGIGFPSIMRMNARRQLKGAVQDLQAELYRTRLEAMRAGKAYVFRYRYDSPVYEILPKDAFDARTKNREGLGAFAVGAELLEAEATGGDASPQPDDLLYQRFLPGDLVFERKIKEREQKEPEYFRSQSSSSEFEPIDAVVSPDLLNGESDFAELAGGDFGPDSLSGPFRDEGWSPPILFFPNGRTSSASLAVRTTHRYEFRQEVALRGLTGTARIDDP